MAALGRTPCQLVGLVPFKDVIHKEDDEHTIISPCPPEEHADIISTLPSITTGFGPLLHYQGVWLRPWMVPGVISVQRRFVLRSDDVLLASPPKCGTTWLKALSFATMARATYPPTGAAGADHPLLRLNPHDCVPLLEALFSAGQEAELEALPSHRLMHAHMHHSLLPPSLADCKIIYICREPKDMLVSMWHFIMAAGGGAFPFSDLFEFACEGKNPNGPIWDHILGYWGASKASPERVLFLRYEEMLLDPVSSVPELALFLGMPFTVVEEAAGSPMDICKLCSFDTMKDLEANNTGVAGLSVKVPHQSFFRKGVVGDWANPMTPEMARRIDAIIDDKLRGSGLSFTC